MIFMPPGGARHGTHRALLSAFHSHGGTPSSLDGENFRQDPIKMDDDWGIPPIYGNSRMLGPTVDCMVSDALAWRYPKPSVGTLGRWDVGTCRICLGVTGMAVANQWVSCRFPFNQSIDKEKMCHKKFLGYPCWLMPHENGESQGGWRGQKSIWCSHFGRWNPHFWWLNPYSWCVDRFFWWSYRKNPIFLGLYPESWW